MVSPNTNAGHDRRRRPVENRTRPIKQGWVISVIICFRNIDSSLLLFSASQFLFAMPS